MHLNLCMLVTKIYNVVTAAKDLRYADMSHHYEHKILNQLKTNDFHLSKKYATMKEAHLFLLDSENIFSISAVKSLL